MGPAKGSRWGYGRPQLFPSGLSYDSISESVPQPYVHTSTMNFLSIPALALIIVIFACFNSNNAQRNLAQSTL
jgi:hypothetical protein